MSWVKLDDAFFRNGKTRSVGKDGRALFVAGLCYCAGELTDGRIPKHSLPLVAGEAEVRPSLSRRLVDAGLWHDMGEHFEVHDFSHYNPPAAKVKADREASAARMRAARDRKAAERAARVAAQQEANVRGSFADGSPVPSPSPSPSPCVAKATPPPAPPSLAIVPATESSQATTSPRQQVFDAWLEATGKNPLRTKFTPERRRLIDKALKNYVLEDVTDAVRGWRHNPHNRGETNGTAYNELDLLLRNGTNVERFRDMERQGERNGAPRPGLQTSIANMQARLNGQGA